MIFKKNWAFLAAMWLKIELEDWPTSKPCIYLPDLIGPMAGLPQQI